MRPDGCCVWKSSRIYGLTFEPHKQGAAIPRKCFFLNRHAVALGNAPRWQVLRANQGYDTLEFQLGKSISEARTSRLGRQPLSLILAREMIADLSLDDTVDFLKRQSAITGELIVGLKDQRPQADSVLAIAAQTLLDPRFNIRTLEWIRIEAHVFAVAQHLAESVHIGRHVMT